MMGYIILLFSMLASTYAIDENEVTLSCPASDKVCGFDFQISRKQTMLFYDGTLGTPIVSRNGVFYKRPKCASDDTNVVATQEELAQVIMVDGTYRHVHTVNGHYIGPSIVVTEGQEVVVNLTNKMFQESLSMHWHGMIMKNTNWMDGVAGLTQCAINPHETFTYRFIASPPGTHWYHLHQGNQRSDGAFGALIVLPKEPKKAPMEPVFEKELIAVINDFYPMDSNLAFVAFMANMKQFLWDGYNHTGYCYGGGGPAPDGASTATYKFYSGLINGKGRRYDDSDNAYVKTPMETYKVKPNKYYRFRVINSAMTYALRVSIDKHPLVVISSDGHPIKPIVTDSVILNPAERFDFYIHTNQTVDKYWFRVRTFENPPRQTLGVVEYEGATGDEPTSQVSCSSGKCVVVNCPFKSFGEYEANVQCVNFEDIKSLEPAEKYEGPMDEYIMAFEKTRTITKKKRNTALGIQFTPPSTPPVVLGYAKYDDDCSQMKCGHEPCRCTQQINLKLGHTIQITMMSNTTHPMHIHGNPFQVVAMGYPEYDPVTAKKKSWSKDLTCNNDLCYNASWTDKSWYNGNIPGINVVDPAFKDSISIPAGGYVVVRFKADNPGWWFVHCHQETHFLQGMALILQVGEDKDMTLPPKDFNKCGSYRLGQEEFHEALTRTAGDHVTDNGESDGWTAREKRLAWGYLATIILGLLLGILVHILYVKCTD